MLSHSDALCFAIRFKVIFWGCSFSLSSDGFCVPGDKKTTELKRDKIPQPRQVKSYRFQPGLYDGQ